MQGCTLPPCCTSAKLLRCAHAESQDINVQSTDVQEGDVRVAVCALPVLAATLPGADQYLLAGRGGDDQD